MDFIGRQSQLAELQEHFDHVRDAVGDETPGRCVIVRGRRRVGKSRLAEVFAQRVKAPTVYFTASRAGQLELDHFASDVSNSSLPAAELFRGQRFSDWAAAFTLLNASLSNDEPSVVIIDELPYLIDDFPDVEGTLQKIWDRLLSRKPVLLILIGSDIAMMESLSTYGRPFYGRGVEMVVPPLSPRETGHFVRSASSADALDAYLITGGLPLICDEWRAGVSIWDFLDDMCRRPTSPLIVSAERVLSAEFPHEAQARDVLSVIGHGERTFSSIQSRSGLYEMSLSRSLDVLVAKRVISKDLPLTLAASRNARYRINDSYLRFWLSFIGPYLHEIERGRGDRVVERIRAQWPTWRGRAIEPVLREALGLLLPRAGLDAHEIGSFWNRTSDIEIDIVGANRAPLSPAITFTGSIKWRESAPFSPDDLTELRVHTSRLPGVSDDLPTVGISRTGFSTSPDLALGPDDILAAWEDASRV